MFDVPIENPYDRKCIVNYDMNYDLKNVVQ